MSGGDLLWFFFLFSAVQPALKQRYLELSRLRLISKIQRQRHSRVILLVHRQETMSALGFPLVRYIDVDDSESVLQAIHLTDPDVPLDIVLHTHTRRTRPGVAADRARDPQAQGQGHGLRSALRDVRGTLIAVAADDIVMSEDE